MTMALQAGARVFAQSPGEVQPQRSVIPQVPLLKPLGATAHTLPLTRNHSLLGAKSVPVAGSQLDPAAPGFVRPDCPPDALEEQPRSWRRTPGLSGGDGYQSPGNDKDKNVSFKSALEHASWLTSQEEEKRGQRPGKFGLGIFGL